jgi:hypothetical protein
MVQNITVTNKATRATTTVTGQQVSLTGSSVIELPLPHTEIKSLARTGNDLVVTTSDGQVIIMHGFFTDNPASHNDLVFHDDGGLWLSDLSGMDSLPIDSSIDPSAGGVFSSVESINPLLGQASNTAATTDTATDTTAATDTVPDTGAATTTAADTATDTAAGDDHGGGLDWLPLALAVAGFTTYLGSSSSSPPVSTQNNAQLSALTINQNTDGTLIVSGHANPNDTVTVTYANGTTTSSIPADPSGNWSVTSPDAQVPGNVSVVDTTTASDSTASAQGSVVIKAIDQDTGTSASDFITNHNALTFSGTLSQPLTTGQSLEISTDGGNTWGPVTNITGTNWTYDDTANPLADGNYTVAVREVDGSGNVISPVTAQLLVIDTTAPTETTTISAINPDTGTSATDFVTGSGSLTFSGTLSAPLADGSQPGVSAESVQLSLDGGQTWHTAAVTSNTDSSLQWSFDNTATALPDGLYVVESRVSDAAGNVGPHVVAQEVEVSASGTLSLGLQDVLSNASALTSAAGSAQQVTINGGGVVTAVTLTDGVGTGSNQWQETGTTILNGITYDVYHNAAQGASTVADLLIQHGITVS